MTHKEMGDVFTQWNKGVLDSFLIEITKDIVSIKGSEVLANQSRCTSTMTTARHVFQSCRLAS
jgi:6-phosphogluconate dehydrogenase